MAETVTMEEQELTDKRTTTPPTTEPKEAAKSCVPICHFQVTLDFTYLCTIHGIIKLVLTALNISSIVTIKGFGGFIANYAQIKFFYYVAVSALFTTLMLLLFYILHIVEKHPRWPWFLSECLCGILAACFYMASASFCILNKNDIQILVVCASIGYVGMTLYGADAIFKFMTWRKGHPPQVSCNITRPAITISTPGG